MVREKDLSEILNTLRNHEQRIGVLEGRRQPNKINKTESSAPNSASRLDFGMSHRAFIKKYGQKMGGPQRFTLLLAYLTKGVVDKSIKSSEIQKCWNRMTALLDGKFNGAYPSRAKENDWVETKKYGEFNLRPSWKDIFKQ